LFRVVRLRRIAGRGADAAIFLGDELVIAERLVGRVTPEFLAYTLMQSLGERFGQAIGQCLHHDCRVVVIGPLETLGNFVLTDASGDSEAADIVRQPAPTGRDKIAERGVGTAFAFRELLTQRMQNSDWFVALFIAVDKNIVALGVGRPEAKDGARLE